jgi:hypothetical protein
MTDAPKQLSGWEVDPLEAITPEARAAEADRRGRLAYRAWVESCARTGVNVTKQWEDLLDDERYQWAGVYGVCVESERRHEAGADA